MNIAFAGAGAIGCHYGSKLQQVGFNILFLARGLHLQALQHHGLQHESEDQNITLIVTATDNIKRLKHCQIIIISCKMTGLISMLKDIQPAVQADTLLVSLQNGVEAPELISAAFPDNAVAAGTAFIGANLIKPGHVIHSAAGGIRMGTWQQGTGARYLPPLIEAFQRASVPARIDADPTAMLWRKLLWNCGFNALTAITRRYAKDMAAHTDTLDIIQQAMQETIALAQARGIAIGEADIAKHIEITLAMGPVKTSMWQDIEAGCHTEIDYLNGYIATQSESLHRPATMNRLLTNLIHAMESHN